MKVSTLHSDWMYLSDLTDIDVMMKACTLFISCKIKTSQDLQVLNYGNVSWCDYSVNRFPGRVLTLFINSFRYCPVENRLNLVCHYINCFCEVIMSLFFIVIMTNI